MGERAVLDPELFLRGERDLDLFRGERDLDFDNRRSRCSSSAYAEPRRLRRLSFDLLGERERILLLKRRS